MAAAGSSALPTAHPPSAPSKSSTSSTPSHRLPRRIAVAQDLEADARIGIGAEYFVPLSLEDPAIRVGESRGGVPSRGGVRAGLGNHWGCRESGKGDGGQYYHQVGVHDQPRSYFNVAASIARIALHKRVPVASNECRLIGSDMHALAAAVVRYAGGGAGCTDRESCPFGTAVAGPRTRLVAPGGNVGDTQEDRACDLERNRRARRSRAYRDDPALAGPRPYRAESEEERSQQTVPCHLSASWRG
jgi:hypothetical protein